MISIFDIPSTDQSVYYLGQIFGPVGSVLPVTQASVILGTMFKTFNTMVLSVAALIVLYVTVVGVMKTAHEGEFMGRNWNSIWLPLRMVLGIAMLVPSTSGYCILQMVIMWIVLQGVGAADSVWLKVLTYTDLLGSPIASPSVNSGGVSTNFQNLFRGLTCQSTAKAPYTINVPAGGGYYCDPKGGNANSSFCQMADDSSGMLNIAGTQSYTFQSVNFNSQKKYNVTGQPQVSPTKYTDSYRVYQMGPNGACGSLTLCDPEVTCNYGTAQPDTSDQIKCAGCKAQKEALQASVIVLGGIAKQFTEADYKFREFYSSSTPATDSNILDFCNSKGLSKNQCCKPISTVSVPFIPAGSSACAFPTDITAGDANNAWGDTVQQVYWPYMLKPSLPNQADFINTTVNNYLSVVTAAAAQTISLQPSSTLKDPLQKAKAIGWIFAGAYYYYLASGNNQNQDAAFPSFTVVGNDPKVNTSNPLNNLRNNFGASGDMLNSPSFSSQSQSAISMSLPSGLEGLKLFFSGVQNSTAYVMSSFEDTITGGAQGQKVGNPLINLQSLGKKLLITAQVLFALIMVVIPLISFIGYFDVFVLGTGVDNPLGGTFTTIMIFLAPLLTLFLGALFMFGASLAIYVPLIPYIIFTMGAIAWLILIIEAMVAGPLVALGILSPSGHDILGKSEPALMLIFGIFLRPTLMIFGLIAAMLMSSVVVTMINAAFSGVVNAIYSNPGPGLVEIMLFVAAYVGIVLSALNKCFSLIHVVPDKTLRWISGGTSEGGEAHVEALSKAEAGVGGAAGAAKGAGAEASGKLQAPSKERSGVAEAKRKEERNKNNPNVS